jgi:hypothetical protein
MIHSNVTNHLYHTNKLFDLDHEIMKHPKNVRASFRNWKKIWFFGVKSWFFTRNTPKMFAPPSASPWICPWSVPIATKVVSSNLAHGKVYLIQHYVIKFISGIKHHIKLTHLLQQLHYTTDQIKKDGGMTVFHDQTRRDNTIPYTVKQFWSIIRPD